MSTLGHFFRVVHGICPHGTTDGQWASPVLQLANCVTDPLSMLNICTTNVLKEHNFIAEPMILVS